MVPVVHWGVPLRVHVGRKRRGYLRLPQMAQAMATSPIIHQSTFQSAPYISQALTGDLSATLPPLPPAWPLMKKGKLILRSL